MTTAASSETDSQPYVCRLDEPLSLALCGGKAFHLRRMRELQLSVPDGLVVTDRAFQRFLDQHDLRSAIDAALRGNKMSDPDSRTAASKRIRDLVLAATIRSDVIDQLKIVLPQLDAGALAVRSSAVGEDSARDSFAGQLDTCLNVDNSVEAVCTAIRSCWASYWCERVLFYQSARGVSLQGMGVIVQSQVPSACSGVLFSRHPAAGSDPALGDSMLIEYCPGLGDKLVAGDVSPERVVVSRTSRKIRSETVPPAHLLHERHVAMLANWALRLETAFGGPQDIEWTIDHDGRLFLLQARPITAVVPGSSTNPGNPGTQVVWSNANVNENFPEPICPLLYSIASLGYYHYFRNLGIALGVSPRRIEAMEFPLRNLVGVHGARLYYNLTNIHSVLRMAPFGEMLTESFNQFVGAGRTEKGDQRLNWLGLSRGRISQTWEASKIVLTGAQRFCSLSSGVKRFERRADEFAARTRPDELAASSLPELLGHLRGFMDIRCHRWVDASLADAAAMISYGLLKRTLDQEFRDGNTAIHNSLLKGLRDVVSGAPAAKLWDLSRRIRDEAELRALFAGSPGSEVLPEIQTHPSLAGFRSEFEAFLDQWGFRCSGELMLTVPSFQERPEAVLDILRAYADLDGDSPAERLEHQQRHREEETRRVLRELRKRWLWRFIPWPRKSLLVRFLLGWAQQSISFRERARSKQALLYSRVRRIALAIGERLAARGVIEQSDDVFFLTVQELESLLAGGSMFPGQTRQLVSLRRAAHAEVSRLKPPDTFALPAGSYWTEDSASHRQPEAEVVHDGRILRGSGVCGGLATGRASVLHDVAEFHKLSRGDILVTRQTDPGWGPVFPLIQGLVIERGGMLSHGAILAREYGLPTVVGIPDATQRIRPGQVVTVNGDRGLVELSE